MTARTQPFPVSRASQLEAIPDHHPWLIESLWSDAAAGILGGAPKCCKTWMGLDMAVSVASGTPCLDRFPVMHQGRALIYLAEDGLPLVRRRMESICCARDIPIQSLDLFVITIPVLRIDSEAHQNRLWRTMEIHRPRLLLLDPLVRLHELDENSAGDIARLLGFLRRLQREFDSAIVLVHHTSKRPHFRPGQALRGSSDLHAFGDSNVYLAWRRQQLVLTIEHRAARAIDPIPLKLEEGQGGSATRLVIANGSVRRENPGLPAMTDRILELLRGADRPWYQKTIREQLRVNNHQLGKTLSRLQDQGVIQRTAKGWLAAPENGVAI